MALPLISPLVLFPVTSVFEYISKALTVEDERVLEARNVIACA